MTGVCRSISIFLPARSAQSQIKAVCFSQFLRKETESPQAAGLARCGIPLFRFRKTVPDTTAHRSSGFTAMIANRSAYEKDRYTQPWR